MATVNIVVHPTKALSCPAPGCGQPMLLNSSIFAERGEWNGNKYDFEGVLETFLCVCGCEIAIIDMPQKEAAHA